MQIWGSELPDFFDGLDRVTRMHFDDVDWPKDGLYPLRVANAVAGGLGWFVYVRNDQKYLVLRRFATSFRPSGGDDRAYTKYYRWAKRGRQLWEARFSIEMARGMLTGFLDVLTERLTEFFGLRGSESEDSKDSNVRELVRLAQRMTVAGVLRGKRRTMLIDCGIPNAQSFDVNTLDEDPIQLALSECAMARTFSQISEATDYVLDEESFKYLLPWTCRYDDRALREGFFAGPHSNPAGEALIAVRDKKTFAADPLLSISSGSKLTASNANRSDWVASPQFSTKPFDAAIEQGLAAGEIHTALGKAPLPCEDRSKAQLKLAAAPDGLSKHRWKVLQLMHIFAAQGANMLIMRGFNFDEDDLMLQIQRTALAMGDVDNLFDDDDKGPCRELLEQTREVYARTVSGDVEARSILQPSQMP